MPEDSFKIENIHYGITNGVVYKHIGVVGEVPFSLSSDEVDDTSQSYYQDLGDGFSGTVEVKAAWWQLNNWAAVFGLRAPYLVANLRRGGKSHRGKARPLWHER